MLDQIVQQGKIDEQLIIQNLIKDQFSRAKTTQIINLIIYFFLFYLPITLIVFSDYSPTITIISMGCQVVSFYFFVLELIQMKNLGFGYFRDILNYLDFLFFLLFNYFCIIQLFEDEELQ